jgi:hypothetical protein
MKLVLSPSEGSAHPTNFTTRRGRFPTALHRDFDALETAAYPGELAPGYMYTQAEVRDIVGPLAPVCIVVLSPSSSLCRWRTFYSRRRFEAFLTAYDLTLVDDLKPGRGFLLQLPRDDSRWLPLEKVPWTVFANGLTFCGDDLDPFGYCGKPFVRGCDRHDELSVVHDAPVEFERMRNTARAVAYSGPSQPPHLGSTTSASMMGLFEALFASRRFMRHVEQPFPGRGDLSESALAMYAQARGVANRVIEELDRRGIPVEERCPQCDATDGLHTRRCPRPSCTGCGPRAPLAGIRLPATVREDATRVWVERCPTCAIFQNDEEAAAALAEAASIDYRHAILDGGGCRPYLEKSALAAAHGRGTIRTSP